jgi:hypothetical protein
MKKLIGIIAATALAATIAAPAAAAPEKKGTTFVVPSATTESVLEGVLKPGKLSDKGAGFGIVGNTKKGPIKHVGGLAVDASGGVGDSYLELRNFWIGKGVITGEVEGIGRAPLFNFDTTDELDNVTLTFTDAASMVIVGDLSLTAPGITAGVASIELK